MVSLYLTILIFVSTCARGEKSLNILAILPYEGKSHFFVYEPYLRELTRRGHNVTVISHFPQKSPMKNYHDISLAGSAKILEGHFSVHRSYLTVLKMATFLFGKGTDNCRTMLENGGVQALWKSKARFDLIVYEMFNSDCALGLAYQFHAPVVAITSCAILPMHYARFGIPYNPSYVPLIFFEGGFEPTLYQRIERTVFNAYFNLIYKYYAQSMDQRTLSQYFENVPPLEELAKDIKYLLVYHYFPLTGSRLFPANVIEVGGYHVSKPNPLTGELLNFVKEAEHGVIYISLGSMLKATSMPPDKLDAILAALAKLPQRTVWKWEHETLPGNPKNIFLSNWLPQNDILANANVVAFISHAGLLSTTEAIHHGVPMIAMPIFGDQPSNAAAVEDSGLGVQLQLTDLTEDRLLTDLRRVLDPNFRENVKRLSNIWHDRPLSAMDTAIYWTEFASRLQNHTYRAKAADIPLYQYLCLDVTLIFLLIFIVMAAVAKLFYVLCCKANRKEERKKWKHQ